MAHTPGGISGLLDDQVQTAAAALDAYEATGDREWLEWGERIMDRVWARLLGRRRGRPLRHRPRPRRRGGLAAGPGQAGPGHADAFAQRRRRDRRAPGCTNSPATPAGSSGASSWCGRSPGRAQELGLYAATYLLAVDWQLNPATHLVVVGDSDRSDVPRPCIGPRWPASCPVEWSSCSSRRSSGADHSPRR